MNAIVLLMIVGAVTSVTSAARCTGQDNGCCTEETPCNIGEGDCDVNRDCKGSMVCGAAGNCAWGGEDSCCEAKSDTAVAKLDFGEPGVNVQPGFYKLGLPDGGSGIFIGSFPCFGKTCTIKVSGYTHTRGRYAAVVNEYASLSNLLRSGFLRNSFGTIMVHVMGLSPSEKYNVKTYHHSTSHPGYGIDFTLQYLGNPLKTLKESANGASPNPPLTNTEIVTTNLGGRISLTLKRVEGHQGDQMNLNGMEIWETDPPYECMEKYLCASRVGIENRREKDVKNACDNDPQCTGYDYDPSYKVGYKCTQTTYPGSKTSEYYKLCKKQPPTTPYCTENDIGYHGNDITGGTRTAVSWEECSNLCRSVTNCQFWTFTLYGKVCYLKSSDIGRAEASSKISGSRTCGTTGSCAEKDIGYFANDIGGKRTAVSWEECSNVCRSVSNCQFWTFTPSGKSCYLKSSDIGRAQASNKISGSRTCGATAPPAPTPKPDFHKEISFGTCTSVSKEVCQQIASQQNYVFLSIDHPSYPPGCYIKKQDGKVCFNKASSTIPCSAERTCLCGEGCPLIGVYYAGTEIYTLKVHMKVASWEACSALCKDNDECYAWTFYTENWSLSVSYRNACALKKSTYEQGRSERTDVISGPKACWAPLATTPRPPAGNVAVDRPVTSSGRKYTQFGYGEEQVTDGDIRGRGFVTTTGNKPWFQIDLGEIYQIVKVHNYRYYDDGRSCLGSIITVISGSNTYRCGVISQSDYMEGGWHGLDVVVCSGSISGRFVKVELQKNGDLRTKEIQVYGYAG